MCEPLRLDDPIHQRDVKTPTIESDQVSQTSRTSSRFRITKFQDLDMKSVMGTQQSYFDHLRGNCTCFKCKCGRCKCQFQKLKINTPFAKNTAYKEFFQSKIKSKQEKQPNQCQWTSHQENNKIININTNFQNEFKKKENYSINKEIKINKPDYQKTHFISPHTSYQFNFQKQDKNKSLGPIPNLSQMQQLIGGNQTYKTSYQQSFCKNDNLLISKNYRYPDNIKSINFPIQKTTYQQNHSGLQNQPQSTFRQTNKQQIQKNKKKQYDDLGKERKKKSNPFYQSVFQSENNRQYKQNEIEVCPMRQNFF